MATEKKEKKPYECDFVGWDKDTRAKVCNREGYEGVPCEGNVRKCSIPEERRGIETRQAVVSLGGGLPAFAPRDDSVPYLQRNNF